MAFDLKKKHLTHSIENIEIYIVYRHSAKKYRDIIFCPYRAALTGGTAVVEEQVQVHLVPGGLGSVNFLVTHRISHVTLEKKGKARSSLKTRDASK